MKPDPSGTPQSVADLVRLVEAGETLKFAFFWGHRPRGDGAIGPYVFSQWHPAPFTIDGMRYPTAEHYMMAEKARLFGDAAVAEAILAADDPGKAKALGRKVRNFDAARWDEAAFAAVVRGNAAKFGQNEDLGAFLRETGTKVLVEASPVDSIWGIGMAAADPDAGDPRKWRGRNLLGFALMAVRAGLDGAPG